MPMPITDTEIITTIQAIQDDLWLERPSPPSRIVHTYKTLDALCCRIAERTPPQAARVEPEPEPAQAMTPSQRYRAEVEADLEAERAAR